MANYYLHLTGGLGNQLFQLAAALSLCENKDQIVISDKNGQPRTNKHNEPDLYSFALPENVVTNPDFRYSPLASKASGYVIRMTANPRFYEKNILIRNLILCISSIINSFYFKVVTNVFNVHGVGYSPLLGKNNFLIGYFQSYKYLEQIKDSGFLDNFELKATSNAVDQLIELAQEEKPLIVHVRRGDYKNENTFGLLGDDYYHAALKIFMIDNEFPRIWVFSDDIDEAKKIFKNYPQKQLRYIDNVDGLAAHSLEVMRYGRGYVIGNSSFSWWAAALRKDRSATVVAPNPWFKDEPEPYSLIPLQWKRLDGCHYTSMEVELGNGRKDDV